MLYYTRNPEILQPALMEEFFGCSTPLTAKGQKEVFQELLEETLGDSCSYETVVSIHENLNELIEEKKEQPEPLPHPQQTRGQKSAASKRSV